MNSKELRGLMEAYAEVYDPQEVDEAIYSEKGKAKAAEMIAKRSTPSGRAKSGKGADVAHIRQIRGSGRGDFDREGLGGTPMTPTMAKNPIKKQNYVGTGNKAARRAGLTPTREKPNAWKEELDIFDVVLEFLQAEGFAETLEEAEWMMANVIDEEAIDIILGEGVPLRGTTPDGKPWRVDPSPSGARQPAKMERNPKERNPKERNPKERKSPKASDYKSKLKKSDRYEEVEYVDEAITSEKGKAKAAEMIAKRTTPSGRAKSGQGASVAQIKHISRANVDNLGGTPPNPKIAKNPVKSRSYGGTGNAAARRAAELRQEEFVGEAQVANRDPEKYEREQNKKTAPVRGEKTPMPPRGDKRREDFEKWYAKQMGR